MFGDYSTRQQMLRAWAAHDAQVYKLFVETVQALTGKKISQLRVLDLGCGPNAPMTVLLHAAGCRVTGVDAHVGFRWGLGFRFDRYVAYAKESGLPRTIRKAFGELVHDRAYFRHLSKLTGLKLSDVGLDLRMMDIQRPEFDPGSFDVVHSNATWEHIADVKAANRLVARALAPAGIAYIEIHLFPSLSGGHDLPWIVPGKTVLGEVTPWRHLRDPQWRPPVFLNRLRERDYRRMFQETDDLVIEDWRVEFTEGGEYATADVLRDLPEYTVDELTKRSVIVVARKRTAHPPDQSC